MGAEEKPEKSEESGRLRKQLDEDDCPICYEEVNADEEARGLVTFCSCCGKNFHKDCMSRWQKASKKSECPFCREKYTAPVSHVAPGFAVVLAPKAVARTLTRKSSDSLGYMNLLDDGGDDC